MSQDDTTPSPHSDQVSRSGGDDILGDMEATIEWLRTRGFYERQDEAHRTVPPQESDTEDIDLHRTVKSALQTKGIDQLYTHQTEAIGHIRDGKNVVVSTPTASGKTFCYTVPAIERAVADGDKTLYLAPQNSLLQDQEETMKELADNLGFGDNATVRWYNSDMDRPEKQTIKRQVQPDITLMTPDMAHRSLIPWATVSTNWRWLFAQLEQIVVDEIHTYRGIFGSEISLLLRRLNRVAERFGRSPQYICTSATIANPIEHAAKVTAQEPSSFELVDEDGSSRGERHWLLWNPPLTKEAKEQLREQEQDYDNTDEQNEDEITRTTTDTKAMEQERTASRPPAETNEQEMPGTHTQGATGGERRSNHVQAKHLFCSLVLKGYQVAVFSNNRQNCETYAQWSGNTVAEAVGDINTDDFPSLPKIDSPSIEQRIRPYHGSLDDDSRSAIETGLKTGAIRGVWSTSALGIGVDIGSLDVVILDSYPGSLMETFQWAGRASRGDDECLVVLVGSDNPLDQRIMEQPDRLFDGDLEKAIVNPENEWLIDDHLVCAADEWPLSPNDKKWFGDVFPTTVNKLEQSGWLTRELDDTIVWRAPNDGIQYNMDLRDTGRQVTLRETTGEKITDLEFRAAMRDAHPDAIYRSDGTTYQVQSVDYDEDVAWLTRYQEQGTREKTELLYDKSVTVKDPENGLNRRTLSFDKMDISAAVGQMVISKDIQGYLYYETHDTEPEQREFDVPVPEPQTTTTGFMLEMPARWNLKLPEHVEQSDGDEDDMEGFTSGYLAALHAIEHTIIGLLPTAVLCDRRDLGGLSTEIHPVAGGPAIFVHDAHEGGAGLSVAAFDELETLLGRTYAQIAECDCADGCHRCVLSKHCGSANRDIWKRGAKTVLEQVLGKQSDDAPSK